ncbi:MAG: BrnT family toxin [Xanthobacteraceae bacterium]
MAEDGILVRRLFERIREVEWNEEKAASNRRKHDFDEAIEIFYGTSLLRRSDRDTEERWLAIGETEGRVVTVVFTWRGDTLRIISARRARRNERRAYYQEKMGRTAEGQN